MKASWANPIVGRVLGAASYLMAAFLVHFASTELFYIVIWRNSFEVIASSVAVLIVLSATLKAKWTELTTLLEFVLTVLTFVALLSALLKLVWLPDLLFVSGEFVIPLLGSVFFASILLYEKRRNPGEVLRTLALVFVLALFVCFELQSQMSFEDAAVTMSVVG